MRMADMLDMKHASVERVTREYFDGTSGAVRGLPYVMDDKPDLFAKPVSNPVRCCEYCGMYSLELKSNCDSCGAGLPLSELLPERRWRKG